MQVLYCYSELMLKVSSCFNTGSETRAPLHDGFDNDSLIELVPLRQHTMAKLFNILDL